MVRKAFYILLLCCAFVSTTQTQNLVSELDVILEYPKYQSVELIFSEQKKDVLFQDYYKKQTSIAELNDSHTLKKLHTGAFNIKHYPTEIGIFSNSNGHIYLHADEYRNRFAYYGYSNKGEWISNQLDLPLRENKVSKISYIEYKKQPYLLALSEKKKAFYLVDLRDINNASLEKMSFIGEDYGLLLKNAAGQTFLGIDQLPVINTEKQELKQTIKPLKIFTASNGATLTLDHDEQTSLYDINISTKEVSHSAISYGERAKKVYFLNGNSTLYGNQLYQFIESKASVPIIKVYSNGELENTYTIDQTTQWLTQPSLDYNNLDQKSNKEVSTKAFLKKIHTADMGIAVNKKGDDAIARLGTAKTTVRNNESVYVLPMFFGLAGDAAALIFTSPRPTFDIMTRTKSEYAELALNDSTPANHLEVLQDKNKEDALNFFIENAKKYPSITRVNNAWYVGYYNEVDYKYQIYSFND